MSHFTVYVFHDKSTSVEELLAPYDENLEMPKYVAYTKAEAIKKAREDIERYKNTIYKEYLDDPAKYEEKYKTLSYFKEHIDYVKNVFPKKLGFTDEECYAEFAKWYAENDLVDADGNILSSDNPHAKWDWWVVGGRWSGGIPGDNASVRDLKDAKIPIPFAFVTPDGKWCDRGEMGWWGNVKNEKGDEDWEKEFRDYLKSSDPETIVTLVDCHI